MNNFAPTPRARWVARHAFSGPCRSASAWQNEARRHSFLARQLHCVNALACALPLSNHRMPPPPARPTTRLGRGCCALTGGRIGLETNFACAGSRNPCNARKYPLLYQRTISSALRRMASFNLATLGEKNRPTTKSPKIFSRKNSLSTAVIVRPHSRARFACVSSP